MQLLKKLLLLLLLPLAVLMNDLVGVHVRHILRDQLDNNWMEVLLFTKMLGQNTKPLEAMIDYHVLGLSNSKQICPLVLVLLGQMKQSLVKITSANPSSSEKFSQSMMLHGMPEITWSAFLPGMYPAESITTCLRRYQYSSSNTGSFFGSSLACSL